METFPDILWKVFGNASKHNKNSIEDFLCEHQQLETLPKEQG